MKILIWGTGYFAEELLKENSDWEEKGVELLGFIETERRKEKYRGLAVFSIDSIPDIYDFIVVANTYSDEIYEVCINLKLDFSKIVFMKRGQYTAYIADKRIRDILGDKYYVNYAMEFGVWKNTFIVDDMLTYSSINKRPNFEINEEYLWPIISEKYTTNSGMDAYFYQDIWGARHIIQDGVKEHYDIGSSVRGFIAHLLAANIKVNMIDVRPFAGTAENLSTVVDDATMMSGFKDNSIASLSALCSLEHFGLGRYGDPVDPEACFKCFSQIVKKLRQGGKLYIAVPVGKERLEFNAHRVFYAETIIECFDKLTLKEFSVCGDGFINYNVNIHEYDGMDRNYVVGLFYFEKEFI